MIQRILFLLLLFYSTLSFGTIIQGFGYNHDEQKAKKESLVDLSSNISVVVKSDYESFVSTKGDQYEKQITELINLKSHLPILGAEFEYSKFHNKMTASLDSKKALSLYAAKLHDLKKEMLSLEQKVSSASSTGEKYSLFELMLSRIHSYKKHEIVYLLLGGQKDLSLSINESDVQAQLIALSQQVDSLELAAKLLTKSFTQNNIYIFAPKVDGSNEITPFASIFTNLLRSYLSSTATPTNSDYLLSGTYNITDKGVFVSLHLQDKLNNILKSSSLFIEKNAYKGIEVAPKNVTFDQEIELSRNKLKSNLKVDLSIKDFGSENVLLTKGQEVELVFKSNKQTYFYIVGHILHNDKHFSYLVNLQEGNGNEKFVYTVGASDVNRPVLLPLSFEVDKPFGYESLHVVASTEYPQELPQCDYKNNGLCVIGQDPQNVIAKTRALRPKIKKAEQAETALNYTTIER